MALFTFCDMTRPCKSSFSSSWSLLCSLVDAICSGVSYFHANDPCAVMSALVVSSMLLIWSARV
eukprot:8063879-Pyramimonas_sp.AAC.1